MSAESLPAGLRERERLSVRRDRIAAILMRGLHGPMSAEAEARWFALEAEYRALCDEIAGRGEVVMGPNDWRRATVQRLPGVV